MKSIRIALKICASWFSDAACMRKKPTLFVTSKTGVSVCIAFCTCTNCYCANYYAYNRIWCAGSARGFLHVRRLPAPPAKRVALQQLAYTNYPNKTQSIWRRFSNVLLCPGISLQHTVFVQLFWHSFMGTLKCLTIPIYVVPCFYRWMSSSSIVLCFHSNIELRKK